MEKVSVFILFFLLHFVRNWEVANSELRNSDENLQKADFVFFENNNILHFDIGKNHTRSIEFPDLNPLLIRNITKLPPFATIDKLSFVFNESSLTQHFLNGIQNFVSLESGEIILLLGNLKLQKYLQVTPNSDLILVETSETVQNGQTVDPSAKLFVCRNNENVASHVFIVGESIVEFAEIAHLANRFSLKMSFKSNFKKIVCSENKLFILFENGNFEILNYSKENDGDFELYLLQNFSNNLEEFPIDFDYSFVFQTFLFLFKSETNFFRSYFINEHRKTLESGGIEQQEKDAQSVIMTNDNFFYILKNSFAMHAIQEYKVNFEFGNFSLNREYFLIFAPSIFVFNSDFFIAYSFGQIYVAKRKIPSKIVVNDDLGNEDISSNLFGFKWKNMNLGSSNKGQTILLGLSDNGNLDFFTLFQNSPKIILNGEVLLENEGTFDSILDIASVNCVWKPFEFMSRISHPLPSCIFRQKIEIEYYDTFPLKEKYFWLLGFLVGFLLFGFISFCMLLMAKKNFSTKIQERQHALETLAKQYEFMEDSKFSIDQTNFTQTEPFEIKNLN